MHIYIYNLDFFVVVISIARAKVVGNERFSRDGTE